jgi:tetratricopeptide (TPR) repeat protein
MDLLVALLSLTLGLWTSPGCSRKRRTSDLDKAHAQVARALSKVARKGDAKEVRLACGGKAGRSCSCARTSSRFALDRDLASEALAVLARAPKECKLSGQRAEALARLRKVSEAETLATKTLAADPQNRFAAYALAHVHYTLGSLEHARKAAEVAVQRGRGAVAHLLVGLIAFARRQYPAALRAFEAMRKLDPTDASALYNIALVHHRQNHYRLAREGYLAALRLRPRFVDARHNLVVLTHNAGIKAESQHHLRKLKKLIPGEARLAKLSALLRRPPRRPSRRRVGSRRPAPLRARRPGPTPAP